MIILILMVIFEALAAWGLVSLLCARTRWKRARIALVAPVPFALLFGGIAAYMAGNEELFRSVDPQHMNLAISIAIGTLMLYLIGLSVAFPIARKNGRPRSPDEVAVVFK